MTLIVGLGNPGKKFQNTRHNLGFRVVDELAKRKTKKYILAKPQTFMNKSGQAVKKLIESYKLLCGNGGQIENLIVVHDDIDITLGKFKISYGRGAAGHKGVESIIKELGTKDFWRVRLGIQPKTGKPKNVEKFVLEKFSKEEEKIIKETIKTAIDLLISDINKPKKN